MIKEAMKYLVELAPTELKEIGGYTYSDAPLNPVALQLPPKMEVTTLESIAKIAEVADCSVLVSSAYVELFAPLDKWNRRCTIAKAEAMVPPFHPDNYMPHENFILWVLTHFEDDAERARLLSFAGNVRTEQVATSTDDGVTQVASVKRGAKLKEEGWKNPVELAPFRTFDEIDQPKSRFIFRINEQMQMGLFTVEDNAWRMAAKRAIKTHLVEVLGVKKEIYL